MTTKKQVEVPFSTVMAALRETRDFCRERGHDSWSRTTFDIDADGDWRFTPCCGQFVEDNGHPDEWGNRSWTLPLCLGDYTDEQVEELARAWVEGEYREYFVFPPLVVVEDTEG